MDHEFGIKHIFGMKLRELRKGKGFSFQQLSKKTGLSISYLNEIEKGKKYPKTDKILALAAAFEVSYDELVSLRVNKKLQPLVDLMASNFFKDFPLEMFGLDTLKIFEMFAEVPDKINAFIRTVMQISRNYEMQQEHFYYSALRSYQELHDNYFPDLEKAVTRFRKQYKYSTIAHPSTIELERLLFDKFEIAVNRDKISNNDALRHVRSIFNSNRNELILNKGLTKAQENFLIGRELGIQFLKLENRSKATPPIEEANFDLLRDNFFASYFSVALLMDESEVVKDVKTFARSKTWEHANFLAFVDKYEASPEMVMQRLTNVLPKHFGMKNIFFLRFTGQKENYFELTKELHLARMHNPHANALNEHYCRRWVSLNVVDEIRERFTKDQSVKLFADAQISNYLETPNQYLILAISKLNESNLEEGISVSIGFLIDQKAEKTIHFLEDPKLKKKLVHTTCERCSIKDCEERVVAPVVIEKEEKLAKKIKAIDELMH